MILYSNTKNLKAYSLLELLLYISLVSIVLTAVVAYGLNATKIKVRSDFQQKVADNIRIASEKISYEIRNARSIDSITGTEIQLTTNDAEKNPCVIKFENNSLYIGYGSEVCSYLNPCKINSNLIDVSDFSFSDVTPELSTTKVIRFDMTMTTDSGLASEYRNSLSVSKSVEVRSLSEETP